MKNVQIIVTTVIPYFLVTYVLKDFNLKLKVLMGNKLASVLKNVVMEEDLKMHVMTITMMMEMDALHRVELKRDGHVLEAQVLFLAHAFN